jgi:choline dehydrogenase-like flavoprotein
MARRWGRATSAVLQRLCLLHVFQGFAEREHPAGAAQVKNFELRPNAHVLKVNLDSDKSRATGVTYIDAQGREIEQPADLVILGAFQFHNVHLMLLSGIGKPYDPITGEGVVGVTSPTRT